MADATACPICASMAVVALPDPHPDRSMASDGRVHPRPLAKAACTRCGHGFSSRPASDGDRHDIYDADYALSLGDPLADRQRAEDYAAVIDGLLAAHDTTPRPGVTVVEFGCGTGALIEMLATRWSAGPSLGFEPAVRLADVARQRVPGSVKIAAQFAEDTDTASYDLCLSVNVGEHATDPVRFLRSCAAAVSDTGQIVIVCPDGDHPDVELLFADHLSSFTTASFALAAARAGLTVVAQQALDGRQSGFRIHLLRRGAGIAMPADACHEDLAIARADFLRGWAGMEGAVLNRIGSTPFAIFGAGEFADLLNAYGPRIVERATAFVVDRPVEREHCGRPVIATTDYAPEAGGLLAAVHPRSWPLVRARTDLGRIAHPYGFCSLGQAL